MSTTLISISIIVIWSHITEKKETLRLKSNTKKL